jgi:hypothetical protein
MRTVNILFLVGVVLLLLLWPIGATPTSEPTATAAPTTMPVLTATPAPTATPARLTDDLTCDANWGSLLGDGGDPDAARNALALVVDGTVATLPGSVGTYLKTCVAEGWLGFWDDEPGLLLGG